MTKGLVVSWKFEGWILGMSRSTSSQSSEFCIFLSLISACCHVLHSQEGSFLENDTGNQTYIIRKALNLRKIENVFHDNSAKETPISLSEVLCASLCSDYGWDRRSSLIAQK